jgi:hypothetical protein
MSKGYNFEYKSTRFENWREQLWLNYTELKVHST